MTPAIVRPMPEVVRDLERLRGEHARLLAVAQAGTADVDDLDALASADAELAAFEAMCVRHGRHHLMATGLRWGDMLRHPLSTSVALVRLSDRVEFEGEETTLAEATQRIASKSARGADMGLWTGPDGTSMAAALRTIHPLPDQPASEIPDRTDGPATEATVGNAEKDSAAAVETETDPLPKTARRTKPAIDDQPSLF
jgi:hypothetical protein